MPHDKPQIQIGCGDSKRDQGDTTRNQLVYSVYAKSALLDSNYEFIPKVFAGQPFFITHFIVSLNPTRIGPTAHCGLSALRSRVFPSRYLPTWQIKRTTPDTSKTARKSFTLPQPLRLEYAAGLQCRFPSGSIQTGCPFLSQSDSGWPFSIGFRCRLMASSSRKNPANMATTIGIATRSASALDWIADMRSPSLRASRSCNVALDSTLKEPIGRILRRFTLPKYCKFVRRDAGRLALHLDSSTSGLSPFACSCALAVQRAVRFHPDRDKPDALSHPGPQSDDAAWAFSWFCPPVHPVGRRKQSIYRSSELQPEVHPCWTERPTSDSLSFLVHG